MGRRAPRIERFLGQDLDRLEALSDGVFAFALTLMDTGRLADRRYLQRRASSHHVHGAIAG
jgi:hypothetical protein